MLREWLAAFLMISGTFFLLAGALGVIRMPDVYTRMHVAAKSDSLGAGLWLLGVAVHVGGVKAIKLLFLVIFIWLTSPTAAHCMARAAHRTGIRPVRGTRSMVDARRPPEVHRRGPAVDLEEQGNASTL